MATFQFDLVSPEKLAFSGEVEQVDIPGLEGDVGVMAGHAPAVIALRPGIMSVTTAGKTEKIIVLGGLAEVSEKGLTVLADVATTVQDLDRAQFDDTLGVGIDRQRRQAPGLLVGFDQPVQTNDRGAVGGKRVVHIPEERQ